MHANNKFKPEVEINLNKIFTILSKNWYWSLLGALICLSFSFIAVHALSSKYRTSGLLQINLENTRDKLDVVNDITFNNEQNRVALYSALLKSNYILAPVIESLHLNIRVKPYQFPILSNLVRSNFKYNQMLVSWLQQHLPSYSWTHDYQIHIDKFIVPDILQQNDFTLEMLSKNSANLFMDNKSLLRVESGGLIMDPASGVGIALGQINSPVGTKFHLQKLSINQVEDELKDKISIAQLSGDTAKSMIPKTDSGLVEVTMVSSDSISAARIINFMMEQLIQRSLSNNARQNLNVFNFVSSRVIQLKNQLDSTESALSNYKKSSGVVLPSAQVTQLIAQISALDDKLMENQTMVQQYKGSYTANHPFMLGLAKQYSSLLKEKVTMQSELKAIPAKELQIAILQRKVDVSLSLYQSMMDRKQELQMAISGDVSPVQILVNASPVLIAEKNNHNIIIGLAIGIGLLLPYWWFIFLRIFYIRCSIDTLIVKYGLNVSSIIKYNAKNHKLINNGTLDFNSNFDSFDFAELSYSMHQRGNSNTPIGVINLASGSGCHYFAYGLALSLVREGSRVLIVDLNSTYNLPTWIQQRQEIAEFNFPYEVKSYSLSQEIQLFQIQQELNLSALNLVNYALKEISFFYDYTLVISAPLCQQSTNAISLMQAVDNNFVIVSPQTPLELIVDLPLHMEKFNIKSGSTELIYNCNQPFKLKGVCDKILS